MKGMQKWWNPPRQSCVCTRDLQHFNDLNAIFLLKSPKKKTSAKCQKSWWSQRDGVQQVCNILITFYFIFVYLQTFEAQHKGRGRSVHVMRKCINDGFIMRSACSSSIKSSSKPFLLIEIIHQMSRWKECKNGEILHDKVVCAQEICNILTTWMRYFF